MQYAEYPEDLVVLKMWLLWWIWTLENASTRWSDDIFVLVIVYGILQNVHVIHFKKKSTPLSAKKKYSTPTEKKKKL